jgi:hypothetical protein
MIFWVDAGNWENFERDFMLIARKCKLPGLDDPGVNTLQLVKD